MKVLVACEESQTVCKAFRERGHEAYSCDIISSDGCNSRGWMYCKSCFDCPAKVDGKYLLVKEEEE